MSGISKLGPIFIGRSSSFFWLNRLGFSSLGMLLHRCCVDLLLGLNNEYFIAIGIE